MRCAGRTDRRWWHRCLTRCTFEASKATFHHPQLVRVDGGKILRTWTMLSSSLPSFASHFRSSRSIFFVWFLDAVDCNLRLRDKTVAVCEAAMADSVWAF